MDKQAAVSDRKGLHAPLRQFCGAHEGILDRLQELNALPELAAFLQRARAGAAATLDLFDHVVLRHHAEEEQELFVSVLRSCRDARESHQVRQLVDQLTNGHRQIEALWSHVRPAVALTAAGKPHRDQAFEDEVHELVRLYREHARLEEEVFLPLADQILGRDPNHMAALDLSIHLRRAPAPSAYI
ncbi:MAG: hemerythrin domain-containing protein [Comamonadaceae bacterium]|nr:MAG: hemerythrin domain-containing protein [Comamonadaceae bacterium]